MAGKLEPMSSILRYGNKGPDKFTFLMEGILDRTYDGRDHEFTIDGKKVLISITGGRPLPAWQCPSHPEISQDRQPYDWEEAWEFSGYGDGCAVRGIYSVRSRKGVYHFWKLYVAEEGCPAAQRDLHLFFAARGNSDALLALTRAMDHMVRGTAAGGHHVDCAECWELFRTLRNTCELP